MEWVEGVRGEVKICFTYVLLAVSIRDAVSVLNLRFIEVNASV